MKCDEVIFGYDIREMWMGNPDGIIHNSTNAISCLRSHISKLLSIDTSLWGSPFGDDIDSFPSYVGDNAPLWNNLQELRRFVEVHDNVKEKSCWIIAVTGVSFDFTRKLSLDDWPRMVRTKPLNIRPDWKLIGYDVCSLYNESVLVGTLFQGEKSELELLKRTWGDCLNSHHLFKHKTDALKFRDFNDQTDPANAPHFVYGLWLIESS